MKKTLLTLVIGLMTLTSVFASSKVDELIYTSSTTGISFRVPANVQEIQDAIEAVILQTPDEEYTFTAEAFNSETTPKDEMSDHIMKMAEAARIDLNNSKRVEAETDLVTLVGEAIDYENGGGAVVGLAFVKGTKLAFYVTAVASPRYVDFVVSSLTTITFDPDAL